ncbi:hypothetical protein [Xenorhabdus japonica]|uniref:Uncharacterized protein n=1 Tax=Xenorhabdus japonica TaxID=53341 RepID=A0A1I4ZA55_9GAMM|nr:hypothetical protein [Xenorhabdus japonica]SFN46780.1 hypothetical protein SAMN05421579_1052 [Xenorhabdus japonica]
MTNDNDYWTYDPRGNLACEVIKLAKRVSISEHKNREILFFDNTKLSFCNYSQIYKSIINIFKERDIINIKYVCQSVRGTMTQQIRELASELSKNNYSAAIIALADMGTSVMTTILAGELEKKGIPALLITSPPGNYLAEHVAFYRFGKLCICHIDIYQASKIEEIENEIEKQKEYIISSLTKNEVELDKLSILKPKMDLDKVNSDKKEIRLINSDELMKEYDNLSIGDGLPIIPPTQERYIQMQQYCQEPVDKVVIPEAGPSGQNITINDIIINSILAGCEPQYLPIIIATFYAMAESKFNFQQSITTSYNGGNLVLVSGPIAKEIGMNSGQGCLGPGFRANATIGRAVNLTILNVCRAYPGKADLGCLGSPAEFTYCFAESIENSPWETINEENYDKEITTVYLMKGEPPTDVVDFLSQDADSLLSVIIDSATHLGRMNAYVPGRIMVILTPDHVKILTNSGWTKNGLRQYLHEEIYNLRSDVDGKGIVPVRPKQFSEREKIPATRSPLDIDLVVAGGRGGHSAIIASWGLYCDAVLKPLTLPSGKLAKSITDFYVQKD